MEWCNQSSSIKYLLKYINKGSYRIGAVIEPVEGKASSSQHNKLDEIKEYLNCRYVSASEACWRIFSYSIHGRKPTVERLFFHDVGENCVYYKDHEQIGDVFLKASVTESMFTSWMEANKLYPEARSLTYVEFVSKFVYVKKKRSWKPRTKGYTIGRLVWVPQSAGELYYLRMILRVAKGPTCYNDLKFVKGVQYLTFREACFALGFLEDDGQFIEAIKEASVWGSGYSLRYLFARMLLSGSMDRPNHVWEKSWRLLFDGILYNQRKLLRNRDTILKTTHSC